MKKLREVIEPAKITLHEAIKLEDYNEVGHVPYEAMKEAIQMLDLDLESELEEFIFLLIYRESLSSEELKYDVLFERIAAS